jgi:hypothetical protein
MPENGSLLNLILSRVEPGGEASFWRDDAGRWYVDFDWLRGEGASPQEAAQNLATLMERR